VIGARRGDESASGQLFVIGHLDDDLAVLACREAAHEGQGCLGERECRVDRNAKLAAVYQFRELDQLRPVRLFLASKIYSGEFLLATIGSRR
jgi:hypothetical protein